MIAEPQFPAFGGVWPLGINSLILKAPHAFKGGLHYSLATVPFCWDGVNSSASCWEHGKGVNVSSMMRHNGVTVLWQQSHWQPTGFSLLWRTEEQKCSPASCGETSQLSSFILYRYIVIYVGLHMPLPLPLCLSLCPLDQTHKSGDCTFCSSNILKSNSEMRWLQSGFRPFHILLYLLCCGFNFEWTVFLKPLYVYLTCVCYFHAPALHYI